MKLFSQFATPKYRWVALCVLSLTLAIIIIDNSVLNVAIPYILRDLHTSIDAIQWVISGYALIIATLLVTFGRIGDMWGRKKMFLLGVVLFAFGSFTASIAPNVQILFLGEAVIEAIGAAMMSPSTLSLIAAEFEGKERSIAFGVWGTAAGVAAGIGPLLGGFFTTYYSWRWSLRINVVVAIIALIGSIFIMECKAEEKKRFDWIGTLLSGFGLFSLVFACIEGQNYGWWRSAKQFSLFGVTWPFSLSIVPFFFVFAVILLILFALWERSLEQKGGSPLLKLSLFANRGFSLGLLTLLIVSFGQFSMFFIFPIFVQNVLGLTAMQSGLALIPTSLGVLLTGGAAGYVASKIGPKRVVNIGMLFVAVGTVILRFTIGADIHPLSLTPGLFLFGIGIGANSAQLTNLVLSSLPNTYSGEASSTNATMRQIGGSIGVAIIGTILASSIATNITSNIKADPIIPQVAKPAVLHVISTINPESGEKPKTSQKVSPNISNAIKYDVKSSIVSASKDALSFASIAIIFGGIISLFIPKVSAVKNT